MDLTQWLDKGGLMFAIGLLVYLLKKADDRTDAERAHNVTIQKERVDEARSMQASIDRNTQAIETLTHAVANRKP
jgi:hypothetical protein